MPEVMAARSGREPTLRSAPGRRRAPQPQPSFAGVLARRVLSRPGRLAASALFAACAVAIALNALAFQTARHPAPLFTAPAGGSPQAVAPAPVRDMAQAPLPPVRTDPALVVPVTPPVAARPAPAPLPPAPVRIEDTADPIGALIRERGETTASIPTVAPSPRITAAQEALAMLGYGPLVSDGLFGPATSAAVARFQRQQGLEVTGGFDDATITALAVRSGLEIPAE